MSTHRIPLFLTMLAVVAATMVGCAKTVPGTPQADPAYAGVPLESESSTSPGGSAAPGADSTCSEYKTFNDVQKRAVIDAISEENQLVAMNPELWIGLADMMCTFAGPTTKVADAVIGSPR
ncbi:hypothetical protein [Mycolicibacterium palauense]|uniref:hypothetical protein n=1 Tax=Mycolicibacterium palauense TaxID=2034511 RepID=UPI000BFEDC3C|nr:hypothetical protein [Mycolicibacterium palauense]